MSSQKRFVSVLALALAAVVSFAGGGASARRQTQQTQPPQRPAPQRPDETLDDEDVERVETDLTNVLFTAVDRNKRFVTALKQGDIRVLEDGVPQEVFTFQRETDRPLSLAIL
ncbi:MAG TPA: hypothetical protein VF611_18075, partial [Pyrinomonadaceae bacterium]